MDFNELSVKCRTYRKFTQEKIPEERKARAAELTVYSVIEEQGMTSRFTEDQLASFVCCENTIRYAGSKSVEGKPCFAINYNTPLGSIING